MEKTRKRTKKSFVFSPPQAHVYAIDPPQMDHKMQKIIIKLQKNANMTSAVYTISRE